MSHIEKHLDVPFIKTLNREGNRFDILRLLAAADDDAVAGRLLAAQHDLGLFEERRRAEHTLRAARGFNSTRAPLPCVQAPSSITPGLLAAR